MRQRNVKNQDEILIQSDKYILNPNEFKGKWKEKKYTNVCLEIGIGKGQFISNLAHQNPENKYIGIELNKGVLSLAVKKLERYEKENNTKLDNLNLISTDAINLKEIFKKGEVDNIYLNFSDPWPKKRHEKRRLTSDSFLEIYRYILKKGHNIEIKTDNRGFFEYSLQNINKNKFNIEYITLDLHSDLKDEKRENIETEYEEKFKNKGPIYKMVIN